MKKKSVAFLLASLLVVFSACYKDNEYQEKPEQSKPTVVVGYYNTDFTFQDPIFAIHSVWKDGANGVTTNYDAQVDRRFLLLHKDTFISVTKDTTITTIWKVTIKLNYRSFFTSTVEKRKLIFSMDTLQYIDSLARYMTSTTVPDSDFTNLFARTSPPFRTAGTNGIDISYIDANDSMWSSSNAVQTAPVFTLSNKESGAISPGIIFIKGDLAFSCLVNRAGSTDPPVLLSGTAKLYFVNSR